MKNYEELVDKYKKYDIDLNSNDIKIYRYEKEDGSFDYELYKEAQTNVNLRKLDFSGPDTWKIKLISDHIKKNISNLKFGLCHGTRRGHEQRDFQSFLDVEVLGTEISHTAANFPNTIQWDFHEVKEGWKDSVCFIFSNSLDHSYDPVKCLSAWMSCIKTGGKIYLQRGPDDRVSSQQTQELYQEFGDVSTGAEDINDVLADIFQAEDEVFSKIVDVAGKGNWVLTYPDELVFKTDKRVVVLERK